MQNWRDYMFVAVAQERPLSRRWLNCRALFLLFICLFLTAASQPSHAIPAFARKYGLPCSACHIGWPILNVFGQQFKDNGFQLGNDRDSPIYQNPAYWPITFRVTPNWHVETQNKVLVDQTGAEQRVTTTGFDLSG